LNKIDGVYNATVNYEQRKAIVEFDDNNLKREDFENQIKNLEYGIIRGGRKYD